MTFSYGFYNSVDGDRMYNAEQFSDFFNGIVNDGVFQSVGTAFTATASGLGLVLGAGRAWFNGTWSLNDDELFIEALPSSTLNHRVDSLVLTVDPRISNRENRLEWVEGTPSASPVAPTLAPPVGVFQYTILDLRRNRDATTVTQANITSRVGSSLCPFATFALQTVEQFNNLTYKRSLVRGNNLGTVMTPAQKAAIIDGSFTGMYLGDYWRVAGVNWRIVDFNYWYDQEGATAANASARITANHVVIVPDDTKALFANIRPFTTTRKATNCGWAHSGPALNRLGVIANAAMANLGSNVLRRKTRIPTPFAPTRFAMNQEVLTLSASPMTEQMVHGSRNLGLPFSTNDTKQLALYKLDERWLWKGHRDGQVAARQPFWMMNQYTMENWTCYHDWGGASAHNPTTAADGASHEIKAVFGLTGL